MDIKEEIEKILLPEGSLNEEMDEWANDVSLEILKLLNSHIERATVLLKSDIARAIGHMQGCGHPDRYLEGRYPEFKLKKGEKDEKKGEIIGRAAKDSNKAQNAMMDKSQSTQECPHRPHLECSDCDSTWSDPRRAIEFLLKWMEDKPALKHNVDDFIHKSKVREIVASKRLKEINCHESHDFMIRGRNSVLDDILEEIK